MSDTAQERARWVPSPLLQGAGQTPRFLRAAWDAQQAHAFGPWRVGERVDPTLALNEPSVLPAPEATTDVSQELTVPTVVAPLPSPTDPAMESVVAERLHEAQEKAHAQGVAEGRAQAIAEMQAERAREDELLRHLAIEMRALSDDPDRFFEPLRRLALHIAEQLVRGELSASGTALSQIVRQCLAALDKPSAKVVISLHPEDATVLEAMSPAFLEGMRLQPEPTLTRGSVRLRLDDTVLEDLIEHRLESLVAALMMHPARAAESVLLQDIAPLSQAPAASRRGAPDDHIIDATLVPVPDPVIDGPIAPPAQWQSETISDVEPTLASDALAPPVSDVPSDAPPDVRSDAAPVDPDGSRQTP